MMILLLARYNSYKVTYHPQYYSCQNEILCQSNSRRHLSDTDRLHSKSLLHSLSMHLATACIKWSSLNTKPLLSIMVSSSILEETLHTNLLKQVSSLSLSRNRCASVILFFVFISFIVLCEYSETNTPQVGTLCSPPLRGISDLNILQLPKF